MFFDKNGQEHTNNADFCECCGAPIGRKSAGGTMRLFINRIQKTACKSKRKFFGLCLLLVAFLLVVALLFSAVVSIFTPGSVKALSRFHKAGLSANAKAYYAVMWSPYSEAYTWDKNVKKDAIEEMQTYLKETKLDKKEENIRLSYKNYMVSKKYKKDEVKQISTYIGENWGYDTEDFKLQAVQVVTFSEVEEHGGNMNSHLSDAIMIKVKGKWYMDSRLTALGKEGVKNTIVRTEE